MFLRFSLAGRGFDETFLILLTMETVNLIVKSIFKNSLVTIDKKFHLIHLPDVSMQVRKKSNNKYLKSFEEKQTSQKMLIPPFQQLMVPVRCEATFAPTNGAVEATPAFERRDALLAPPALVTLTDGRTMLEITYPHSHTYTLDSCVVVANFKVMTTQQTANTKPVPHFTAHEQPHRGVRTHPEPVVPRTDGKRWRTTVPISGDV